VKDEPVRASAAAGAESGMAGCRWRKRCFAFAEPHSNLQHNRLRVESPSPSTSFPLIAMSGFEVAGLGLAQLPPSVKTARVYSDIPSAHKTTKFELTKLIRDLIRDRGSLPVGTPVRFSLPESLRSMSWIS